MKKLKCFYFTYAGCWSTDFIQKNPVWFEHNIQIICIKYTIFHTMTWTEFMEDILKKIIAEIGKEDYLLWGHSMGATVAYESYYELKKRSSLKQPLHVYVSSGTPPHKIERNLIDVSDKSFEQEFIDLGGIQTKIINSKAMLKLTMRVIKRDVLLLYKYNYERHAEKMECPLTVLFGDTDKLARFMYDWNDLPLTACENILCEGNHFFIFNMLEQFVEIILRDCAQ